MESLPLTLGWGGPFNRHCGVYRDSRAASNTAQGLACSSSENFVPLDVLQTDHYDARLVA